MCKSKYLVSIFLPLTIVIVSCTGAPSHTSNPVIAGHLYSGDYINVRAPNSDGWYLVNSSPAGMEFARSGIEQDESFGAQVLIFPLSSTQTKQDFIALVKNGVESDTSSDRFSVLESEFKYSTERKYPCVRVSSIAEDKEAKVSRNRQKQLILQLNSLYCRHPVRQDTGFSVIYSHRGHSAHTNLASEANEFIIGVQVPE